MRPLASAALIVTSVVAGACGDSDDGPEDRTDRSPVEIGVDASALAPTVDHPHVAFAAVRRAVYEGEEVDPDTGEAVKLRVESTVRPETKTVAGVDVTVVEVLDYEDGELVEKTEDYYAQHRNGDVYYLGERVDEYEDGEVVSHGGQWLASDDGNRAGLFMPASPAVGDVFEQEQVRGVAEDRSTVVAVGASVTVPAGTFDDCIETEDFDPIDDVTEHKFSCSGVGLVQEVFAGGGSLDLVEFEKS